jgi:hypothetical protein
MLRDQADAISSIAQTMETSRCERMMLLDSQKRQIELANLKSMLDMVLMTQEELEAAAHNLMGI